MHYFLLNKSKDLCGVGVYDFFDCLCSRFLSVWSYMKIEDVHTQRFTSAWDVNQELFAIRQIN